MFIRLPPIYGDKASETEDLYLFKSLPFYLQKESLVLQIMKQTLTKDSF